jgi:hypothetical protein
MALELKKSAFITAQPSAGIVGWLIAAFVRTAFDRHWFVLRLELRAGGLQPETLVAMDRRAHWGPRRWCRWINVKVKFAQDSRERDASFSLN